MRSVSQKNIYYEKNIQLIIRRIDYTMATNFFSYSKMPILKKGNNPWFYTKIKSLKLSFNKTGFVVMIDNHNSLIIENDISKNPDYNAHFTNKIFEYHKQINKGKFPQTGKKAKEAVFDVVRMIDLENNTNIWKYKKTKRQYLTNMVNFMVNVKSNFWNELKSGNPKLVDKLIEESGAPSDADGPKSLASKICKYLSELMWPGSDSYYINDSVIRHVLPYYLNFYAIKTTSKNKNYFDSISYGDLFDYMEKIRKTTSLKLKKSEIDHIMWYCYRYEK